MVGGLVEYASDPCPCIAPCTTSGCHGHTRTSVDGPNTVSTRAGLSTGVQLGCYTVSPRVRFQFLWNHVISLDIRSIAYAYASRHLSTYPLSSSPEARIVVSRLVPFLVARDDKTRFPGIESAATDIYSRFGAVTIPLSDHLCI